MMLYPVLFLVAALGGFLLGVSSLSLEDPGWFAAILFFVVFMMSTAGATGLIAYRWWRRNGMSRREALRWWLRHRHVFMEREL